MTSARKQRARILGMHAVVTLRQRACSLEDQLWDRMSPVGREFGSPDFGRLMEDDFMLRRGVFDPDVLQALGTGGLQSAAHAVPESRQG